MTDRVVNYPKEFQKAIKKTDFNTIFVIDRHEAYEFEDEEVVDTLGLSWGEGVDGEEGEGSGGGGIKCGLSEL